MKDSNSDSKSGKSDDNFELEWIELKEKMSEMGRHKREESFTQRIWSKTKENPLVPIGISATTFCLTYGLISLRTGDSRKQQLMMRGRVIAQGFTVFALISGIMYSLVERAKVKDN